MDTLTKLQEIEDTDFERLITAYVPHIDPSLRPLVHTGVNEEGKPIPFPVDGILRVPGDPPKLVSMAITTIARRKLRGKWLGTNKDPGDLAKAATEFARWRADDPRLRGTLYLATNRTLAPDADLYRDAVRAGLGFDIDVRIMEATALTRFLDYTGDGQYLRRVLLGLAADRLSESMLRDLGRRSLELHRGRFAIASGQSVEVERDATTAVFEALDSQEPLVIVQGASGVGKSTLLRQVGARVINGGGMAMWIPGEYVDPSAPVDSVVLSVLRQLEPGLGPEAGRESFEIAGSTRFGLVLLVDDVNRLDRPDVAWSAVRSWCEPGAHATSGGLPRRFKLVVPLWPGQSADGPYAERIGYRLPSVPRRLVELGNFGSQERATFVSAVKHGLDSAVGMQGLIEALGGDPLLTSLAARVQRQHTTGGNSRATLAAQLFTDFIEVAASLAATIAKTTRSEMLDALNALVAVTLENDAPEPFWSVVRGAVSIRQTELLFALSQINQLGWIERGSQDEVWRWKHERLRDAIVGRWLANNVLPRLVDGATNDRDRQMLSNPGLAEAWCIAMCFLEPDRRLDALKRVIGPQPLAAAKLLQFGLLANDEAMSQLLYQRLRVSLLSFLEPGRRPARTPQHWIASTLAHTDSARVRQILGARPERGRGLPVDMGVGVG